MEPFDRTVDGAAGEGNGGAVEEENGDAVLLVEESVAFDILGVGMGKKIGIGACLPEREAVVKGAGSADGGGG